MPQSPGLDWRTVPYWGKCVVEISAGKHEVWADQPSYTNARMIYTMFLHHLIWLPDIW
jgi:hypothetical protein